MLDALFPMPRSAVDTYGGQWYTNRVKSLAGVVVDEEIALTYGALWCAVRILCEAESTLRLPTYERETNGDQREAPDSPVYNLLDCQPNPLMGAMPFRAGRMLHMVGVGNGFAEIERDSLNRPVALWPIHPGRVKAPVNGQTDDRGRPVPVQDYLVRSSDGSYAHIEAQDMLHIPGAFPEDGRWGKGVVTYHREVIGAALGADRVAATQFGSGNVPRVVIFDPRLKDTEQRREFRRDWQQMHGSPDAGNPGILWGKDAKIEKLSVSSADAQFLESRKFSKEEMATIVGVPVHMLNIKGAGPQGTVEQRGIEFVVYHLLPWLRAWEAQANLKLFRPDQRGRFFVQHRLEGLIRGDMTTRYNCYKTAIMIGLMSVNECRRLEGLPSIGPDGDIYLCPLNMTTLKAMRQGGGQANGGRRGLGSDQSGSPADQDKPELAGPAGRQLAALETAMRTGHRSAMQPVPARDACGGPGSGVPGPCPEGEQDEEVPAVLPRSGATVDLPARQVLVDALGRQLRRELHALARHRKRPDFDQWLAGYYRKETPYIRRTLDPLAGLLAAIGCPLDADRAATAIAADAVEQLGQCFETGTPQQMTALLDGWATARAELLADHILHPQETSA